MNAEPRTFCMGRYQKILNFDCYMAGESYMYKFILQCDSLIAIHCIVY